MAGYGDRESDIEAYSLTGVEGIMVDRAGNGWKLPDHDWKVANA